MIPHHKLAIKWKTFFLQNTAERVDAHRQEVANSLFGNQEPEVEDEVETEVEAEAETEVGDEVETEEDDEE